jgi:hypothetical protein
VRRTAGITLAARQRVELDRIERAVAGVLSGEAIEAARARGAAVELGVLIGT